ncbi:MAG TPA: YraN family protein [Candidatus Corynebacterium avicola]|uniref:UPF0102 protein H9870_08335 n=1 Tax=Candidatus Corynebacterium avicola TaxID=2838527 RepID=A0A9D1RQ04_9CORY|nr:YraN family protein [Candidatus Corynebacterium avicola]
MAQNNAQGRGCSGTRRNLRDVGARGEDEAAAFFEDLGYRLLARNFYTARGEVDIVLRAPEEGPEADPETVVFVEVKWRLDDRHGTGAEAVTVAKLNAMRYAAMWWLEKNPEHRAEHVRFDVLDITSEEITHYEGVEW